MRRAAARPGRARLAGGLRRGPRPMTAGRDGPGRSSSSAPASAGLSAACHLPARATTSRWSRPPAAPGGRAGTARARRLPVRHRADGADHAPPGRRCFHAARRRDGRPAPPRPGRPDVPGGVRRRQRAAGPPGPRGDDRGDPPGVRARRGRRVRGGSATGSAGSTGSRCRTSSSATTTARSTWCARSARRSTSCAWARSGGSAGRWPGGSPTSGCAASSASSRSTPAWRRTRRSPCTR